MCELFCAYFIFNALCFNCFAVLGHAFQHILGGDSPELKITRKKELFVNAQWALGGEGTGAPVHYHNTAWSALVYGAKKWTIYPPHSQIMSNKQILDYRETDLLDFSSRGVTPVTCVQMAGDVMIIPESWGHGVLNIQESIAIATEVRPHVWRMAPSCNTYNFLPGFDNIEATKTAKGSRHAT